MPADNELEEIRRKKLEALRKQQEANQQRSEVEQLLAVARQVCSEKAYDRLTNLQFADKTLNLFKRALQFCIAYFRRTGEKVSDETLRAALAKMTERREPKIEFRRK